MGTYDISGRLYFFIDSLISKSPIFCPVFTNAISMRFLGALTTALLYMQPASAASAANNATDEPTLPLSSDTTFNFQFLIALGNALSGGSDIGPVLGAARNIVPGDMASYSAEFHALALATKAQAEDPANAYDAVNVRDTWFSASHYFRRADFYLHGNWSDPRLDSYWAEQTAAFDRARAALPFPNHRVRIPASSSSSSSGGGGGGNFTVEAIWYGVDDEPRRRPTLIVGNGFDAAQEDSYHYFVAAALARGWNCITYEGPGQCTVRRDQDAGFIPDWERVVTPVVDYVLSEKAGRVDPDRLVLVGNSFGGYLAARAAAFEPRLSAAVLVDGVWDAYDGFRALFPPEVVALYEAGDHAAFDERVLALRASGNLSTMAAWGVDQGLWSFRTRSPSALFTQGRAYHLRDVAHRIRVPVFVGDAAYDNSFPGQPAKVKEAIGDNATLHRFEGTAGYHCQTAALQELSRTMFAWLGKTLG
ncbi:hypothetical protein V2A60_004801 [Cordyceps javanica]|uniref:2,6-dihydropseudooxynicotine hydrolase n=1 Tax=Cordyceps javanica TaxID=43265 RepID=A0A545VC89_9HYPO|nr:2,6-dihydropseudooxynicotine hydrolase [Cordyceps javanica]TQW10993.1 2,6-dihydropseudooxynicotine hydrolase [Cordyceps javanica]